MHHLSLRSNAIYFTSMIDLTQSIICNDVMDVICNNGRASLFQQTIPTYKQK